MQKQPVLKEKEKYGWKENDIICHLFPCSFFIHVLYSFVYTLPASVLLFANTHLDIVCNLAYTIYQFVILKVKDLILILLKLRVYHYLFVLNCGHKGRTTR